MKKRRKEIRENCAPLFPPTNLGILAAGTHRRYRSWTNEASDFRFAVIHPNKTTLECTWLLGDWYRMFESKPAVVEWQ